MHLHTHNDKPHIFIYGYVLILPQNGDELCVKTLVAFGADVNALNSFHQTPLDIATDNQVSPAAINLVPS